MPHPPWMIRNRHETGFTLLELLVVLFLVSLVIGVAATRFSAGTGAAEVRAETRKLASLLRHTRTRAVAESRILGLTSAQQEQAYRLQPQGEAIALPDGLTLQVAAANRDVASSRPGIFFYPDGSSNGGTLTLSSEAGSGQIDINWLTGEVAIARH